MTRGKKYNESLNLVDKSKLYDANEAVELALKTSYAKFDETVELHVRLGVDGRNADQQVRGVVVLPNGTGKTVKVLAIVKGDNAEVATKESADFVGADDMIAKIQGGWFGFDTCITTPDMMPVLGRVAKILGPKGLMPNPKSGTVTTDIKKTLKEIKAGKVEYRLDKNNIVHVRIGKVSFGVQKLTENYNTLMEALVKAKPAAMKGTYIKSVVLSSTMGPGIRISYNG